MWAHHRAAADSADQAQFLYETFIQYDGQWAENVILQTKTGPFDFQVALHGGPR
jgi:alpha-glucuronidase